MKKLLLIITTIILILNCNAQQFGSITDSRDGQAYKTVRIGTQWWMAQNLNFFTPTGSAYYENDSAGYAQTYGRLYTWTSGNASCPAGWHMPTHNDWKKLENYLGISPDGYDAIELPHASHPKMGTNQGGMLKKDTSLWRAPNTGAKNTTGFSALPAGVRHGNDAGSFAGKFGDLGSDAHFWAGEYSSTTGYIRVLSTNNAQIEINDFDKSGYRSVRCVEDPIPDSAKYFGQTPPGDSAVIFAPGIISLTNRQEHKITFSPDGKECFFVTNNGVYCTKYIDSAWTEPVIAAFPGTSYSADGNRLYFDKEDGDIWFVERTETGWGNPQLLPSPINSPSRDFDYSESIDGVGYFSSNRSGGLNNSLDIWRVNHSTGSANQVENLGSIVNSSTEDFSPCIAPDGSYLIFASYRISKYSEQSLWISFNKGENGWTKPIDMNSGGAKINYTGYWQKGPSLSPDGKYLFFNHHTSSELYDTIDVYWVSTHIMEGLKKVAYAPKLSRQLPTINIKTDSALNYIIPENTFTCEYGTSKLKYTATLKYGEPLPSWLEFDADTRTLKGTPTQAGIDTIKITATNIDNESASCTFKIKVALKVGISELDGQTVGIFPNPTTGLVNVSFGNSVKKAKVEIHTLQGTLVLSKTFQNTPSATIDLTGNPAGMYVVKIIADGACYEEKILKE